MKDFQRDYGIKSVNLAIDLLELVAFSEDEMSVTQIAAHIGIPKGSVFRHLHTWVTRGYLVQNAKTSRYGIGPKGRLLAKMGASLDLTEIADVPMHELRDEFGHSVVLSELTPEGALVLQTIHGKSAVEIGVRKGSILSFNASAQGQALLAFLSEDRRNQILSKPLQFPTPHTLDKTHLKRHLNRVRETGYAIAPEQAILGINALAAPIFDEKGACIAAVAAVGSIQFITGYPDDALICGVIRAAEHISKLLGYNPTPNPRRASRKRAP